MLVRRDKSQDYEARHAAYAGDAVVSLNDVFQFARTYAFTVVASIAAAVVVAAIYLLMVEPSFTSTVSLIIDPGRAEIVMEGQDGGRLALESAQVESQVEVIQSEPIIRTVVQSLNLQTDPEFVGGAHTTPVGAAPAAPDQANVSPISPAMREAIESVKNRLYARRVGQSYVIDVSFRSSDPEKTARIANAIANAYIDDELSARAEAAKRGSEWLQERLVDLRTKSFESARAVEEFKTKNHMIQLGTGGFLEEQQLTAVSGQLIDARLHTAEMKARLQQIEKVLDSGALEVTVTEALQSGLIAQLRQRYLDGKARESELESRYGPGHAAVQEAQQEVAHLQSAILDELHRIADVYKNDYQVAMIREASILDDFNEYVRGAEATQTAKVSLAELISQAQTDSGVYENFLQKFAEIEQKISFPVSDARVVTEAAVPLGKSHPQRSLVLAMALLVGAVGGTGISLVRHAFDRSIRSREQIRMEVGIECLGVIDDIDTTAVRSSGWRQSVHQWAQRLAHQWTQLPHVGPSLKESLARLIGRIKEVPALPPAGRIEALGLRMVNRVVAAPFSQFTDELREIKSSFNISISNYGKRCFGFVAPTSGEGTTVVASNLALLFAAGGLTTLLIDANSRHPAVSRTFSPRPSLGFAGAIRRTGSLLDAVVSQPEPDFYVLPIGDARAPFEIGDWFGSEATRAKLQQLRDHFDVILFDLPALDRSPNARAISPFLDAMILVCNRQTATVDRLRDAVERLTSVQASILGVVINRVDRWDRVWPRRKADDLRIEDTAA